MDAGLDPGTRVMPGPKADAQPGAPGHPRPCHCQLSLMIAGATWAVSPTCTGEGRALPACCSEAWEALRGLWASYSRAPGPRLLGHRASTFLPDSHRCDRQTVDESNSVKQCMTQGCPLARSVSSFLSSSLSLFFLSCENTWGFQKLKLNQGTGRDNRRAVSRLCRLEVKRCTAGGLPHHCCVSICPVRPGKALGEEATVPPTGASMSPLKSSLHPGGETR